MPAIPDHVSVAMTEIADNMQECLLALAVGAGLQVMAALMEVDVTELAGPLLPLVSRWTRSSAIPRRALRRSITASSSLTRRCQPPDPAPGAHRESETADSSTARQANDLRVDR